MQQPKVCTVVTGSTIEEFILNLEKIQAISEMVELRVDYIKDLKLEDINILKEKLKVPAIFTCRRQENGGEYRGNWQALYELNFLANELGFEYIDIDVEIYHEFNNLDKSKSKSICSYHNFDDTPRYEDIQNIVDLMHTSEAEIHKFAFMINEEKDKDRIYRLILDYNKGKTDVIAIGMGGLGRETRIVAPLLGSFLTFASTKYGDSAPGQIDVDRLKKIYRVMLS